MRRVALHKFFMLFFPAVLVLAVVTGQDALARKKWNITGEGRFGTQVINDSDFIKVKSIPTWCGVARLVNCGGLQALEYSCTGDATGTPYTNNSIVGPVSFQSDGPVVYNRHTRPANSPGFLIKLKGIELDKQVKGYVGEFKGKIGRRIEGKRSASMEVQEYQWVPPAYLIGTLRKEARCKGSRKEFEALLFDVEDRGRIITFFVSRNSPAYSGLSHRIGEEVSLAGYVYDGYLSKFILPEMAITCFVGEHALTALHICD